MNMVENRIGRIENIEFETSLKEYFIELLKENWDSLLLVTRKGYWIYKTLMDDDAWQTLKDEAPQVYDDIVTKKKTIYTDRYLNKCFDINEFKGRRIYIFDDTMTHGSNLFFYFSFLTKEKIEVTPSVYALSTEYPSEQSNQRLINEFQRVIRNDEENYNLESDGRRFLDRFNQSLMYKVRLAQENIARLSIYETEVFNENLCPLVIDLPILSCMRIRGRYTIPAYMNSGTGEGIIMTRDSFEKLTENTSEWTFHPNRFEGNYLDNCSSYFTNCTIDTGNLSKAIHDIVIKCKYKTEGDYVRAVFVPFAIFKSMDFADVISSFSIMWGDTGHGKEIYKYINSVLNEERQEDIRTDENMSPNSSKVKKILKDNHNLCRNLYRSIIFYVSAYAGALFKEYVFNKIGIELDYDWEFMKESMSESFIASFKELIREKSEYDFKKCFIQVPPVEAVPAPGISLVKNGEKKNAKKEHVEKYIRKRIIFKRNNTTSNLMNRVYIFENIERDLSREFTFNDGTEAKSLLTMVLLDMLENSRLGNEIFIDNQKEVVYRGFKSGENSEVLFYKGMEFFFSYIYAFYYLNKEEYERKFQRLIDKMDIYFKEREYTDYLLSKDDMRFYEDYFGGLKGYRLDEQISNKKYVLDRYWDLYDTSGLRQFIDQAWNNVCVWMR